ncbi:MAG TPA: helix-turn-helix domain-containing protein [Solirubrobacterales bacterium]|nr:helix-turn-helix domain-containing protein [Solirubrobacterales bacterium]
MPRGATKGGPPGRPPTTSRAAILDAARELIERDGWEKLTIRRLATEIGASPATVYYHVRDKDDLLVQVLNFYAEELLTPRPELPDDPRERIAAAATLMHDGLAARPWVVEIITADDLLGESALWFVESMLEGAIAAGADPERAVHLYRQIWYYTAGEILIRARRSRRHGEIEGPTFREQALARLDPDLYPRLSAVADRWPELTAEDTYAAGLRALIGAALP